MSLVGAGGKSTLMYWLGETLARQGKRVLMMTTTHIFCPWQENYAGTADRVRQLWLAKTFAVIGQPVPNTGKLTLPEMQLLNVVAPQADWILVESDGAKRHPVKAPRAGEPVILPQTELVMAVMGLSAVGSPLGECCFGLEQAMALLGAGEDHCLTAEDAALLLASPEGGRKGVDGRAYCVILNQCDGEQGLSAAEEIAARLAQLGITKVFATAFDRTEQKYYNRLANAGYSEA